MGAPSENFRGFIDYSIQSSQNKEPKFQKKFEPYQEPEKQKNVEFEKTDLVKGYDNNGGTLQDEQKMEFLKKLQQRETEPYQEQYNKNEPDYIENDEPNYRGNDYNKDFNNPAHKSNNHYQNNNYNQIPEHSSYQPENPPYNPKYKSQQPEYANQSEPTNKNQDQTNPKTTPDYYTYQHKKNLPKLYPSIHYTEYKAKIFNTEDHKRYNPEEEMERRMKQMKQALQQTDQDEEDIIDYRRKSKQINNQDDPHAQGYYRDDYTQRVSNLPSRKEKYDRELYEKNMVRNTNPINQNYNHLMENHVYSEHWGDVKVIQYRVRGTVQHFTKVTENELKGEFLKNGFQVINFRYIQDPLSGRISGEAEFKARILTHQQRDLEKFISNKLGLSITSKK